MLELLWWFPELWLGLWFFRLRTCRSDGCRDTGWRCTSSGAVGKDEGRGLLMAPRASWI